MKHYSEKRLCLMRDVYPWNYVLKASAIVRKRNCPIFPDLYFWTLFLHVL